MGSGARGRVEATSKRAVRAQDCPVEGSSIGLFYARRSALEIALKRTAGFLMDNATRRGEN
jgi:hypothetical protein